MQALQPTTNIVEDLLSTRYHGTITMDSDKSAARFNSNVPLR